MVLIVSVYPGDSIHSLFEYDIATLAVNDTFTITPGEIGLKNDQTVRTVYQNSNFRKSSGVLCWNFIAANIMIRSCYSWETE